MTEHIEIDTLDDDCTGIIVKCNKCIWTQTITFRQLCLDNMVHRSQIYSGVQRRKCPLCNAKLILHKYLFVDGKQIDNPLIKSGKRLEDV